MWAQASVLPFVSSQVETPGTPGEKGFSTSLETNGWGSGARVPLSYTPILCQYRPATLFDIIGTSKLRAQTVSALTRKQPPDVVTLALLV
ncbi:hypothetical protein DBR17_04925 [Sphingomonas sp. HMWF008]|nr:hypothetical protein DBR17_04925 [Sphingomonas sp. HMWF008]